MSIPEKITVLNILRVIVVSPFSPAPPKQARDFASFELQDENR